MTSQRQGAKEQRRARDVEWDAARVVFEREPTSTFSTIAVMMKVSKQRARQVAIAGNWRKKSDMVDINAVAQVKADAHFQPAPPAAGSPAAALAKPSDPVTSQEVRADQKASDLRAEIAVRHRNEWGVVRGVLQEAIGNKARNMEVAKLAKVVAETLKITQDGERKAWGMDAGEATPGAPGATTKIIIQREQVPYAAS